MTKQEIFEQIVETFAEYRGVHSLSIQFLIERVQELEAALKAISSNPHVNLGDLIYQVRERELLGWDGPAVKAWSDAVTMVNTALGETKGELQ